MHTRDYSDETARVIDEEVEAILREQEQRTQATLTKFRPALDAIAKALLERETLDGDEISRLADGAMGFKAGGERKPIQPDTVTPNPTPAPVISEPGPPPASAPAPAPVASDGAPNGNGAPHGAPPPPPPPPARPPFTPATGD